MREMGKQANVRREIVDLEEMEEQAEIGREIVRNSIPIRMGNLPLVWPFYIQEETRPHG